MRTILAPALLRTVVDNLKEGNNEGRLFEMGNIYVPKQLPVTELPDEIPHVGFAAYGKGETFFTVKGAVEALGEAFGMAFGYERASDVSFLHPGISAYILCGDEKIGYFGKLANELVKELDLPKDSKEHQEIYLGEIDYKKMIPHMRDAIRYKPIPEFPEVERDLSLVVDEEITCGAIEEEIRKSCKQLGKVELFDIYRGKQIGEGKKSMSFKLAFVPEDKAFEPKDIDRFVKKILGNLSFRLGIEIR